MRPYYMILFLLIGCKVFSQEISIIPQPVTVKKGSGTFQLTSQTVIAVQDDGDRKAAEFFRDYVQEYFGIRLDIDRQEGKDFIRLRTRKFIQAPDKDAYTLSVAKDGVTIEGDTYAGTFYGIQSLIQLLPPSNMNRTLSSLPVPFVTIQDYPRFTYRGMHLDVGRHMFPVDFIKKYIDYIALHKMNYFHWHLTEDQGWRIEIKQYPELMSIGAYRNGTIIGRFPGKGNDNTRYGGFYTQDQVKEIVQYAADRHITVVPEIELPGHSSAAIAAYPWLSCFPEKPTVIPRTTPAPGGHQGIKKVQETWGVFDDVYCAGKDSTFTFLQNVLDEVIPLFPSKYIHIGGDECPKAHWKKCPSCQARIKAEGLKDEHELQSYFIQRIEKYLNAKGKTIIGWDEILEGGLAPNAVVMSWRGEKGGIEAAKQKHYVIMTPNKPVYFDHSQTRKEDSVTIGGYNPVESVYAYEPIPKELNAEAARYILGAQANVWTEYIKYPSKVEYHIFPRMSALSEVLWSPKEKKNWKDFEKRLQNQFKRYDLWKANYSRALFDLKARVVPAKNNQGVSWVVESPLKGSEIRWVSGTSSSPQRYTTPIPVQKSDSITAYLYQDGKLVYSLGQKFGISKSTGKKIILKTPASGDYPGAGATTLVDGIVNTRGLGESNEFLGFKGGDLDATIDLGKPEEISSIAVFFLHQPNNWIYKPAEVKYFISLDGKKFREITEFEGPRPTATREQGRHFSAGFTPRKARFVKLWAKNHGNIAQGNPGEGTKAWLFVDEIEIL